MPDSTTPGVPADLPVSEELVSVLLNVSLTGIMVMQPVYDTDGRTIIDFTWVHLNPAAQHMLRLPERPAQSFLTQYPTAQAAGSFGFYRDAFLSGQLARRQNNYQQDGLDGYYLVAAQRQGAVLVVSFTDTNDQPRTDIEEALRRSQARELAARAEAEAERNLLQAVLTQSPVAIGLFQGDDCVVTSANDQLCAMWGHPRAQVVGRPLLEGVPELRGQGFTDLMREVARTQVPHVGSEVPTELLHHGKLATRYFNFVYQPLYGPRRQVLGVIDIAIDVTEQVRARQQMQQLNQELEQRVAERTQALALAQAAAEAERRQLHHLFMQAPAPIAILDGPNLVYQLVNPAYQRLFPGKDLLGRALLESLPELAGTPLPAILQGVYRSGESYLAQEVPLPVSGPEGGPPKEMYCTFVYQARRNQHNVVDGILVFAHEVTDQVLARQAIEANAQRLRLLTDALPVLIAYIDTDRRYRFVNHAYRAWFNRDPAQLIGQTALSVIGEKAYATVEAYMNRVLAGERLTFETHMRYRQGFEKHIHTDYIPDVRDGQVHGFYSLVTDVTEQALARQQVQQLNQELAATNAELKSANEDLREANTRLRHSNVDLDTFVYTASHDLKAPIANIEGLLVALREQLPAPVQHDGDITHLLDLMHGSVRRFQHTLVHLTDVSKLQLAHAEPAEPLDVGALAEAVALDLAPALQAAGGQLFVDVQACPTIRFSPKNLRSILYNLLSNAIKYHDPARPLQVHLQARRHNEQVVLEVQDNGLGLTTAQQAKLFQLFRRLHTHVEGTGVGLYMVKRMVENAGGRIEVSSLPGAGSTFRVLLPARQTPPPVPA